MANHHIDIPQLNFIKMIKKIKHFFKSIFDHKYQNIELLGRIHLNSLLSLDRALVKKVNMEFNGYSQGGEDGVILFLCHVYNCETAIEIGTENWEQSNLRLATRLFHLSTGLIDGDMKNMKYVNNDKISYLEHIKTLASWVNKDNINTLIDDLKHKMNIDDVDIISLDIDGVDYHVMDNINSKPKIFIVEYNSIFGDHLKSTVPYSESFYRYNYHYSGTIYGSSYQLWIDLFHKKGYELFFTTSTGNNMFFVRKDIFDKVNNFNCELKLFSNMSYRESLDQNKKRLKESSFEIKKYLNEVKIENYE
jgi:hypothetical protein